jgi:hypothetical protein
MRKLRILLPVSSVKAVKGTECVNVSVVFGAKPEHPAGG